LRVPLRLVFDTNVVLSALLWGGKPAQLLHAAVGPSVVLYSSQWLIDELAQSLGKPKLARRVAKLAMTPEDLAANFRSLTVLVEHGGLAQPVSRDPDDDFVLACGLAASADVIVTGDDDLLVLGAWQGIAIMTVSECLEVLAALTER
jgi:uncharacterized protein